MYLLARHGITPSTSLESPSAIANASPDIQERRTYVSQIPNGAIYLSFDIALHLDASFPFTSSKHFRIVFLPMVYFLHPGNPTFSKDRDVRTPMAVIRVAILLELMNPKFGIGTHAIPTASHQELLVESYTFEDI
jgi:hypothetical protein